MPQCAVARRGSRQRCGSPVSFTTRGAMTRDLKHTAARTLCWVRDRVRVCAIAVLRTLPGLDVPRWDKARWDRSYEVGDWDRLRALDEGARYSVLSGYVRLLCSDREPDILDVGCGEGLLLGALHGVPFARYLGTDISETVIERASQRHEADPRSSFRCTDLIPTDLGPFDVVVFNEVLPLAANPGRLVARALDALRAGDGLVLVSVWRHSGERKAWQLFEDRFERLDVVDLHNRTSRNGPSCRIACYRPLASTRRSGASTL